MDELEYYRLSNSLELDDWHRRRRPCPPPCPPCPPHPKPDCCDFLTKKVLELLEQVDDLIKLINKISIKLDGEIVARENGEITVTKSIPYYTIAKDYSTGIVTLTETIDGDSKSAGQFMSSESVQSDWEEEDTTSPHYIMNKPDINSLEERIENIEPGEGLEIVYTNQTE